LDPPKTSVPEPVFTNALAPETVPFRVKVVEEFVWMEPVVVKTTGLVEVKVAVVWKVPPLKVRVPAELPKLFSALI
jgi:hypothetical protein